MALAATTQIIEDGPRNLVVKLTGTDTIDPTLFAGIQPARSGTAQWTSCAIKRVVYNLGASTSVALAWDATTDLACLTLEGNDTIDFTQEGFLQNNAGTGKTGSLIVTKTGSAGMNVVLWLIKQSTAAA
jgi:hypothetical protein